MKVAFVTTQLFDAPRNGGEMCSARLLGELLRAGHELHVIGRGSPRGAGPDAQVLDAGGWPAGGWPAGGWHRHSVGATVTAFDALPRRRQLGSLMGALTRGRASTVHRLSAGGVPAQVRRLLAALPDPQLLVVDHLQPWAWLACASPLPPLLLVMHNLESDGYAERALQAAAAGQALAATIFRREARLLRRLEVQALQQAAVVACLSEGDALVLRELALQCGARARVEVLPGYPLPAPLPTPLPAPRSSAGECRIGMLGTWTWGPNRAALRWMLEQVLPRLPAHCSLVLAGSGLQHQALPARVRSLGRVDDTRSFYDSVDVVAVPSLGGSGVQEKAIEAIASTRPVVATSHALRGLGPGLPGHVQTADQPQDFARLCAAVPGAAGSQAAVQAWARARADRYREALSLCLQLALGAP